MEKSKSRYSYYKEMCSIESLNESEKDKIEKASIGVFEGHSLF